MPICGVRERLRRPEMPQPYTIPPYALHFDDEAEIRDAYWNPQAGDRVIDIGARYGSYTLPALAAGAHVTAVDYNAEMLRLLTAAADLNGFDVTDGVRVPVRRGDAIPGAAVAHRSRSRARPPGSAGRPSTTSRTAGSTGSRSTSKAPNSASSAAGCRRSRSITRR